jgi:WD40 repeat protein
MRLTPTPHHHTRASHHTKATHTSLIHDAQVWEVEWARDGSSKGVPRALDLKGHSRKVMSAAISADGGRAATASEDGTLRVWRLDVRYQLKVGGCVCGCDVCAVCRVSPPSFLKWGNNHAPHTTLHPRPKHHPQEDAKTILTVPLQQLGLKEGQVFDRMEWGPDGTIAAALGGHVTFINAGSGQLLERIHAHDGVVQCMRWGPGVVGVGGGARAAVLATCGADRRVRVWRSPKTVE